MREEVISDLIEQRLVKYNRSGEQYVLTTEDAHTLCLEIERLRGERLDRAIETLQWLQAATHPSHNTTKLGARVYLEASNCLKEIKD